MVFNLSIAIHTFKNMTLSHILSIAEGLGKYKHFMAINN